MAIMARVMPQPGQGSPVSLANGHGKRLQPMREPAKRSSTVTTIHLQSVRCRISGAIQGFSSRFAIIHPP
jgi:hypothetical protein